MFKIHSVRCPLPKILFCLLLGLFFYGCAGNSVKANAKKEKIQQKKENYAALYEDVSTKSIQAGLTTPQIRELYGESDNIFSSGSGSGMFEIWTYEKVLAREDKDWQQIRLYFNNGRLTTWSY